MGKFLEKLAEPRHPFWLVLIGLIVFGISLTGSNVLYDQFDPAKDGSQAAATSIGAVAILLAKRKLVDMMSSYGKSEDPDKPA